MHLAPRNQITLYLYPMPIFPSFPLIGQPDNAGVDLQLSERTDLDLLVVYDTELPFLERVLGAAGYDEPAHQIHLLRWTGQDGGLDLARIVRRLQISKVILFGQDQAALGLHFVVAPYFPVTVGNVTYMICPSVKSIADAKTNGDNGPAGSLWRGVKAGFLREA